MLTIRLQRTGRSGHAQFRMVVQDSRFSPTSGRVVAYVGSYDPHSKEAKLDAEKISGYLANGAQPSPRVVKLLKQEKIAVPSWVKEQTQQKRAVRNPEKRRSTAPEQPAEAESPTESAAKEQPAEEASAEPVPTEEATAEETAVPESATEEAQAESASEEAPVAPETPAEEVAGEEKPVEEAADSQPSSTE